MTFIFIRIDTWLHIFLCVGGSVCYFPFLKFLSTPYSLQFHFMEKALISKVYTVCGRGRDTSGNTKRKRKLSMQREEAVCAICREELSNTKQLQCKHRFHSNCINKWFKEKVNIMLLHLELTKQNSLEISVLYSW